MKNITQFLTILFLSLFVLSCGGGGGSGSGNDEVWIDRPVADAGVDQVTYQNVLVTLDGSASYDPEGEAISYNWWFHHKPGSSSAILTGETTANPTFTPDVKGIYEVYLLVDDGNGFNHGDIVAITVLGSGDLEPVFGIDGVVTSNPSNGNDLAYDVVSDGTYLYIVGDDSNFGDDLWRIEKRSLSDGELDLSFGVNGIASSNVVGYWEHPTSVVIEGSYLYIAGVAGNAWQIEKRSLDTGALDAGFGVGGTVSSDPSAYVDYAYDIISDDTFLYSVGIVGGADTQWRIEKRKLSDGALDVGFSGGVVTSNPSASYDATFAVKKDSTHLYIVGHDLAAGDRQWRIEKRRLSDGALDSGFGTGGVITSNPTIYLDEIHDIVIDGTSLYVVGIENDRGRIEKRNLSDGALDLAFGIDGSITSSTYPRFYTLTCADIDGSSLYVAGRGFIEDNEWQSEKRDVVSGDLDATFWRPRSNPSPGWPNDLINSVIVEGNYLYLVGYDESLGVDNAQWRIEKRLK